MVYDMLGILAKEVEIFPKQKKKWVLRFCLFCPLAFVLQEKYKMESPETNDSVGRYICWGENGQQDLEKKQDLKIIFLQINLTNDGTRYSHKFLRNSNFTSDCQFDFKTEREKAGLIENKFQFRYTVNVGNVQKLLRNYNSLDEILPSFKIS